MESAEPRKEPVKLELVSFKTTKEMTVEEVKKEIEKRGLRLLTQEEMEALVESGLKIEENSSFLTKKKENL